MQDTQTIKDLWISLSKLSQHIVEDNTLSEQQGCEYPVGVREMQLVSLKALLKAINNTHSLINMENKDDHL